MMQKPQQIKKPTGLMRFILVCSIAILFCSQPTNSLAYDNDTHFWLTYYLAVKAGYAPIQATQIASADISVDLDKHTQPATRAPRSVKAIFSPIKNMQTVHRRFHAFPSRYTVNNELGIPDENDQSWNPKFETDPKRIKIAKRLVEKRKTEFWQDTLRAQKNPGRFLHYLQDSFAHEGFTHFVGHVGYNQIDFLAGDETRARTMVVATLKYLIAFKNSSNPKTVDVDSISLESIDMKEIDTVLQKFFSANPVRARREGDHSGIKNCLVLTWEDMSEQEKKAKVTKFPRSMLSELKKIQSKGLSSNSYAARKIVADVLKIEKDRIPEIWAYDYKVNHNWRVTESAAKKAMRYLDSKITLRSPLNYKQEGEMKKKSKVKIKRKRRCLPYRLVANSVAELPQCD